MSGLFARDGRARLVIVAAAVLAFCFALSGDFVYDDVHSVRDNSALTSLSRIPDYFVDVGCFSSVDCRLYRPALLTTFAIDGFLGGMRPWMFKLTNLLLHIAAALLLFGLARRFGARRSGAVLAACLFAVHPMASEAINTVSGRSNLLMVVALLAAVRCHVAAMDGQRFAILGTIVFGLVSVGSKEPGMILPVVLLILEGLRIARHPRRSRDWRGVALRAVPAVVLVVVYLGVRSHLLGLASLGVGQWEGTNVSSGHSRGLATQLATMAVLLPKTLLQVVAPHGITMDPDVPFTADFGSAAVIFGALFLLLVTLFGLAAPRRRPLLFFGTCLAWGTAAPWVLKPLNLPFLEHRYYGVLAGLCLIVAGCFRRFEFALVSTRWRMAFAIPVMLFAWVSASRSLEFASEKDLWTVELARNPDSRVAMAGMAVVHMQESRFDSARPYLEALVETYPDRRDVRMNLAEACLKLDDPHAALVESSYLVKVWKDNPFYWLLHSRALAATGQFDHAVEAALHCLTIAEPKGLVYRTAASARRLQGDLDSAIRLLDQSVARGLDHSSVLLDRSGLLAQRGRVREARADLERARRREPFNPRVLEALRRLDSAPKPPR